MSKKYTGLVDALNAVEAKLGSSFLEAETTSRNTREIRALVETALLEFMKVLGGERYVMYFSRELKEDRTTFIGTENCEPNDIINVYESMQEKILASYDPQVFAALGAAAAVTSPTTEGRAPRDLKFLANALGTALDGLPQDVIDRVEENMRRAVKERNLGDMPRLKKDKDDVDPLSELM